ncbi:hypothetical protein RvY_14487 [Ramazzottius varieornatus]|uniref:RNA helicase n=1 Tax=Ramazzottius varieornatus TaxID=947166 RepID=A0A1D1VT82_RAMVA|nr:hypothetical protein RvY_14487 [Ramazzottius varieornatus]
MPVRAHPRTRLQLPTRSLSPPSASVSPPQDEPHVFQSKPIVTNEDASLLDSNNDVLPVGASASLGSSEVAIDPPTTSNSLASKEEMESDADKDPVDSLQQSAANLRIETSSRIEVDLPQDENVNEEAVKPAWDESRLYQKKIHFEHPYIELVDSPIPPEEADSRPNGLFAHNIIPAIGACITLRGGMFYDGSGNRPKKASEQIMRDHWGWQARKREYDREMMIKRRKRMEPWAARASRKLEVDQGVGTAEHYIPDTLSADKEEDVFGGLDEVVTGPYIDDAMELTITCSYEGPWTRPPDTPQPVFDLQGLRLPTRLHQNVIGCKIEDLLPVQRQVIPLVQKGFDVIGVSPTGTGKTACFLIPIIQGIYNEKTSATPVGTSGMSRLRALIIVPTRELAAQIQENTVRLSYGLNVTALALYGAIDFKHLESKLAEKPDIIVATAGRLKEVMEKNLISVFHVKYVVVDEVDRMMVANGFADLTWVFNHGTFPTLDKRQTLFFSATISEPQTHFLKKHQFNPFAVRVGVVGPIAVVQQSFERTKGFYEKLSQLYAYLEKAATENLTVIIFAGTKSNLTRLVGEMKAYSFAQHHGDLIQVERAESLRLFTTKEVPILLTTDISSRGLDIEEVGLIINFHMPPSVSDYIHRVGRTGRKGHGGSAVTFYEPHGKRDLLVLGPLINLLRSCGVEIPSSLNAEVTLAYQTHGLERPEDDSVVQTASDLADMGVYLQPEDPVFTSTFKAGF